MISSTENPKTFSDSGQLLKIPSASPSGVRTTCVWTWEGDYSFLILTKIGIKYINRLYMNPINNHLSTLSEA